MARKFPFKFNFDEDADPVEELHRLRMATAKHFKTLDAIMEYHRTMPTAEEMIAELKEEIAEEKTKRANTQARTPKTAKKDAKKQRKATKRAIHAHA